MRLRRMAVGAAAMLMCVSLWRCGGNGGGEQAGGEAMVGLNYERGMRLFFEDGDLMQAYDMLSLVEKASPKFSAPYFRYALGFIYRAWHDYDRAVAYLRAEYDGWPDAERTRPFPFNRRETLLWLVGDAYLDKALLFKGFYNTAINVQNNYYTVLAQLQERRREASVSDSLILHPPRKDYLHYFRGMCRFYLGRLGDAAQDLKQIDETSELYLRTQAWLAALQWRSGDRAGAEKAWAEMQRKKQALGEVGAARLFAGAGSADAAADLCRRAADAAGDAASARLRLHHAWGLGLIGDAPGGMAVFQALDLKQPEFREVWGKMLLSGNDQVEYATDYYDPLSFRIVADLYLDLAEDAYRQYIEASGRKDFQVYIGLIQLARGDFAGGQQTFQALQEARGEVGDAVDLAVRMGRAVATYKQTGDAQLDWRAVAGAGEDKTLWRSTAGYVLAHTTGDWKQAQPFCRIRNANVPGYLSRNLGYVLFAGGLQEANMDLLAEAIGFYEKNHIQESQYSVRRNDPFVLQKLSDAFYNRNIFDIPPKVYLNFRNIYPETEQIFQCLQVTRQIWEVIKWRKGESDRLEWREAQRLPNVWFDEMLKQVADAQADATTE